jgi:PAS domain-containing protein
MIETDIQKRETRNLWVALAITISIGVYHLLFNIILSLQYISDQYAQWVSNLMFLWILALLWITYRRWRNAVQRQRELRNILTSISTEVIMVVDSYRRIQMVNESVNIFGFSPEEVVKKTTDLLYLDRRVD